MLLQRVQALSIPCYMGVLTFFLPNALLHQPLALTGTLSTFCSVVLSSPEIMAFQARALLTSKWLADAMKTQSKMRILDTSWYLPKLRRNAKSEFKKKHIPGAAFFDIDQCCDKTSPLDHMLPSEKVFADYVGNLGIEKDTHVVLYDANQLGAFSAPRVWWMFRVFGHSAVSVLNGGLRNWELEGKPVTNQYVRPTATDFKASLSRSWIKNYEDILDNMDTKRFQVVDARPEGRFRGLDPEPRDSELSTVGCFIQPGNLSRKMNHKRPGAVDERVRQRNPISHTKRS